MFVFRKILRKGYGEMSHIIQLLIIIIGVVFALFAVAFIHFKWAHLRLEVLIPRFTADLSQKTNEQILHSKNYKSMIRNLKIFSYIINSQVGSTRKDYVEINDFMVYKILTDKQGTVTAQVHLRSYPLHTIKTKFSFQRCAEDILAGTQHILENKIADKIELITHSHLMSDRIYQKYIYEKLRAKNYSVNYTKDYNLKYLVWIYCEIFLINNQTNFLTVEGFNILRKIKNIVYISIER